MTDRIVKASGPAEFLALVPRLVGFRPSESLVLVAFSGKRTGSAMRFDLPPTTEPARLDAFARHLVGMLCRVEQVTGVIPVVYTAAPFDSVPLALFGHLAAHADTAGLEFRDAFCVAGDGWGRVPGGPVRPLAELGDDHPDLLDPAAELRLPEVSAEARAAFAAQLTAWRTRSAGPGGRIHGFAPGAGLAGSAFGPRAEPFLARAAFGLDTSRLLEGMLTEHTDEGVCPCMAALAALAAVPSLRDHFLLHVAWGPRFGARVRRAWLERDEDDPLASDALAGGEIERPSVLRIEAGLRAVRAALAHLDPQRRAPLLACAGWFEWALGRGSVAGAFVDLALEADRRQHLAHHLRERLQQGVLPEWAFRAKPGLSLETQVRRIA